MSTIVQIHIHICICLTFLRRCPLWKPAWRSCALGHFTTMVWHSLVELAWICFASHRCLHYASISTVSASRSVISIFDVSHLYFALATNSLVEKILTLIFKHNQDIQIPRKWFLGIWMIYVWFNSRKSKGSLFTQNTSAQDVLEIFCLNFSWSILCFSYAKWLEAWDCKSWNFIA